MIELEIVTEPNPPEWMRRELDERLAFFNVAATGFDRHYDFAILLSDRDRAVAGGLLADIWGNWLHINILWIDERARGFGYGRRLIEAAERYAIERGCGNAYLSTYSFQARPLYEKLGYAVFGALEDFPPGHTKYYMRKRLA